MTQRSRAAAAAAQQQEPRAPRAARARWQRAQARASGPQTPLAWNDPPSRQCCMAPAGQGVSQMGKLGWAAGRRQVHTAPRASLRRPLPHALMRHPTAAADSYPCKWPSHPTCSARCRPPPAATAGAAAGPPLHPLPLDSAAAAQQWGGQAHAQRAGPQHAGARAGGRACRKCREGPPSPAGLPACAACLPACHAMRCPAHP